MQINAKNTAHQKVPNFLKDYQKKAIEEQGRYGKQHKTLEIS